MLKKNFINYFFCSCLCACTTLRYALILLSVVTAIREVGPKKLRQFPERTLEAIDDSNSQRSSLSDIICPEILSLSYNKHGKGFGGVNLKSSPESD